MTTDPAIAPDSDSTRRNLLRLGVAAPVAYAAAGIAAPGTAATRDGSRRIRELERTYDTTIGFAAMNLRTGERIQNRAEQRFPMCSVFKAVAAAAVLRDHDRYGETLGRRVFYPPADVLEYAPVTREHVEDGMTVRELCDAAIRYSDNTAANLLLREIGGPRGLTSFVRTLGDDVTRLDRWETALNSAIPGDPRDTTSPRAIARTISRLLVYRALHRHDRRLLRDWMLANTTSDHKFRAGLPDGWRLADKTGGGAYGTNNDVGVAWSPSGDPVVIAALTRMEEPDAISDDVMLAELAALTTRRLG